MKTIELKSWEEFEKEIPKLKPTKTRPGAYNSSLLFRGQCNSDWALTTTLERYLEDCSDIAKNYLRITRYHELVLGILPMLTTFIELDVDVERMEDIEIDFDEFFRTKEKFQAIELMVFLRHYGFPSPLLDWTHSPYVAAYFAFAKKTDFQNVSIFAFREYVGHGKGGLVGAPKIMGIGPNVKSDRRHFNQQCEYTVCLKKKHDKSFYCNHHEALAENAKYGAKQDKLVKFIIPSKERAKVLGILDRMNINSYSIFQSNEAMMELLAYRALFKNNCDSDSNL